MLDKYFKTPLLWDYTIASSAVLLFVVLFLKGKMILPVISDSFSLTGDLTNIALTLVGFILTILTVLITFKDNSKIKMDEEEVPVFSKFFSTDYYFESVKHLKNCIKSITIIAALGFFFKLLLTNEIRPYLFFFNVFGLIIIILTVYRCLLIIGRILELQKSNRETD